MDKKIIKGSSRGLTFSFKHDKLGIGSRYNYVVVPNANKIFIVPTERGLKVSRKKTKIRNNSLIDIRNKKVLKVTTKADKLGVVLNKHSITVTAFKEDKPYLTTNIHRDKNLSDKENIIRVVSLFSGCGMLDYPFHLDDKFEMVFAADLMPDACKSYKENIGDHIVNGSICDITGEDIPNADMIMGGVPCTPFSNANRSANNRLENHKDSELFLEYVRLVNEGNYKAFVIENVPQILTACNGDYFKAIKECLPEWKIEAKVLKDCDFGGYTIRKRAFIVGSKIGEIEFPKATFNESNYKTVRMALEQVTEDWYNYNDITVPKASSIEKMKYVPQGGNFLNIPKEIRGKGVHSNTYKRLHMDEQCCTLTNFRKCMITHPLYNRVISVAEALAISGFKAPFKVLGSLNNKQQQVGNGVPFNLGNAIKDVIKKLFINYNYCLN